MNDQDRDDIDYQLQVEARKVAARRHMEHVNRQINSGAGRRMNPEILNPRKKPDVK